MNYKEILSHITGISVPVFGVQWNPPPSEKQIAKSVIAYFEDRRVLYNPFHLEFAPHCVESVSQIRGFLTNKIGVLGEGNLQENLQAIRVACRKFLDTVQQQEQRRIHFRGMDTTGNFFTALGELRSSVGLHLGIIAVMHGLDIEEDLASILPPSKDDTGGDV